MSARHRQGQDGAGDARASPNRGSFMRGPGAISIARRLLWLCPLLGLVLATVVLWAFGLSWWIGLVAALLLACPLVLAWGVLTGLDTRTSWEATP
jgi:hypothetical protein